MTTTIRFAICTTLALVLSGCWFDYYHFAPFPKRIEDVRDTADYPLSVAGFERVQILSHARAGRDVSVAYRFCGAIIDDKGEELIEIWAVLRMRHATGRDDTVQARFEAEKAIMLKLDPAAGDGILETVTLRKNDRDYAALRWSRLSEGYAPCIGGQARENREYYFEPPVPRYVELIVWRHEDRILTLRSYARPDNRDIAPAKNLELLDAVNWTVLPF